MTNNISMKKSTVAGKAPDLSIMNYGELALNLVDRRLYFKALDPGGAEVLDYFEAVPPENTSGAYSEVLASYLSKAEPILSSVLSSYGVAAKDIGTVAGGWGSLLQLGARERSRNWQINSVNGSMQLASTVSTSAPFQDFGEYFENATGTLIPLGTLVALDGAGVRPAGAGDNVLGVVSATAAVALGDTPFDWQGKYLRGEFGELIKEAVEFVAYIHNGEQVIERSSEATPPPGAALTYFTKQVPVINPAYDPTLTQTPRSEREDEWSLVGMIGQVHVRVTNFVTPGDFIKPTTTPGRGGKASTKTNLQAMKITQPFDAEKGYAVALCLLK